MFSLRNLKGFGTKRCFYAQDLLPKALTGDGYISSLHKIQCIRGLTTEWKWSSSYLSSLPSIIWIKFPARWIITSELISSVINIEICGLGNRARAAYERFRTIHFNAVLQWISCIMFPARVTKNHALNITLYVAKVLNWNWKFLD